MKFEPGWYPVSLSTGLENATSTGVRLFGKELVVWRDLEGRPHVWEDRCPHRGMRLSLGFVRGSQIACLYHGWHYDAAGQCRYIPAHPQLTPPPSIKVELYGVGERAGLIWAHSIPTSELPELPDDRAVVPVRSIYADCTKEQAFAELAATELPPFRDGGSEPTRFKEIRAGLVSLTSGGDELLIGIHPISETETALHISIAGGDDRRGDAQKHFTRWAEGLRRRLESLPAAVEVERYASEAAE